MALIKRAVVCCSQTAWTGASESARQPSGGREKPEGSVGARSRISSTHETVFEAQGEWPAPLWPRIGGRISGEEKDGPRQHDEQGIDFARRELAQLGSEAVP
jgi:hypothetical protein